ncbi:10234_t:CDS:2 [Cetraspora pellucida]|uniref:10234_t:CDS:1 n=1 Tax=Cetraspora pellucida TaxID=1433469 RepID=A0A9N9HHV5_9GLOM|nr:10234_t:CDS:2 [Cetraspora pellucida]
MSWENSPNDEDSHSDLYKSSALKPNDAEAMRVVCDRTIVA